VPPGPLSSVAEISVGALPLVSAPTLLEAFYENCTMTWQWAPALERGKVVHSYDLTLGVLAIQFQNWVGFFRSLFLSNHPVQNHIDEFKSRPVEFGKVSQRPQSFLMDITVAHGRAGQFHLM